MVMRSTFRFMASQFSTDLRSAMRFSISLGSRSGAITPGMGNPMGAHIRFRNSNGSLDWVSWVTAATEKRALEKDECRADPASVHTREGHRSRARLRGPHAG